MVVTISPSFSLYSIVVLPAASSPTKKKMYTYHYIKIESVKFMHENLYRDIFLMDEVNTG